MKLKQALDHLNGQDTNKIDMIIERTTKELEDLKAKLSKAALSALPRDATGDGEDVFDEDFVFR